MDEVANKYLISCTDLTLRRTAVLYPTKTLYFVHTVDFHALFRLTLTRLVAFFSRRRLGFDPRPVRVKFVVVKVSL